MNARQSHSGQKSGDEFDLSSARTPKLGELCYTLETAIKVLGRDEKFLLDHSLELAAFMQDKRILFPKDVIDEADRVLALASQDVDGFRAAYLAGVSRQKMTREFEKYGGHREGKNLRFSISKIREVVGLDRVGDVRKELSEIFTRYRAGVREVKDSGEVSNVTGAWAAYITALPARFGSEMLKGELAANSQEIESLEKSLLPRYEVRQKTSELSLNGALLEAALEMRKVLNALT